MCENDGLVLVGFSPNFYQLKNFHTCLDMKNQDEFDELKFNNVFFAEKNQQKTILKFKHKKNMFL